LIEPTHIILLGLAIAFGGIVWQWRRSPPTDPKLVELQSQLQAVQNELARARQSTAPPATRSGQAQPEVPPIPEVTTAPYDIPLKIAAIDEARKILKEDVQNTLNEGFSVFDQGMTQLRKHDRRPLLNGLQEFRQSSGKVWRKIEDLRKDNDRFEDIHSILTQTYRESFEQGVDRLTGAIGNLGDPPYKLDLDFFLEPFIQKFRDGMSNWGKWMHTTDAKLVEARKKLSR
jgi:hypothetical protein